MIADLDTLLTALHPGFTERVGSPRESWRLCFLGGCSIMAAQRKYPKKLRERAVNMAFEIRERDRNGRQ